MALMQYGKLEWRAAAKPRRRSVPIGTAGRSDAKARVGVATRGVGFT